VGAAGYALLPVDAHSDRAVEARSLVAILNSQSGENARVLFYSQGAIRWDLRNQLVWYGDRPVDLLLTMDEVRQELAGGRYHCAIFDKKTYNDVASSVFPVARIIGQSAEYVCLSYP
jgi:hypothetical protein